MFIEVDWPPKETLRNWSAYLTLDIQEPLDIRAVNVKVLDGVEWKDLKVKRDRGSKA